MAEVKKLSASKITTYLGCSMAFFLKYIQHEKIPENIRLTFGKDIHYMLESFYKKNFKSDESFCKFWKRRWFDIISGKYLKGKEKEKLKIKELKYFAKNKEGKKEEKILLCGDHTNLYNLDESIGIFFGYMKMGENILKKFYDRHIIEKKENNLLRKPPEKIEMNFGNKKDNLFDINGHLIQGFIDRIDEKNGKWYITDYKTDRGSPEKDSFVLHRNIQFTLYSYVFRELFGIEETAILYYHLRSGNIFKTHRNEGDYDYLKRMLDEVVENIMKDKFIPFYGFHCNFCDYKIPCEKYSLPYHGGPRIDLEGKIRMAKTFDEWDIETPEWMEMNEE